MVSIAHARSVITGLENLKAKGVTADWIDPKIEEYKVLLTRAYLLDGQPDPSVVDADGLLTYSEMLKRTQSEDEGV